MNWKKALLVTLVGLFALMIFAVAAVGLLATAGLATAAAVIANSGVVEAFEEVADDAQRLQIDIDDNSVTFTNPDNGESRTVTSQQLRGRGRIDFNLPEITITNPDNGQSRVIRPSTERFEDAQRAPRVVWDGDADWVYYGPDLGLRIMGSIFRGLFSLTALALIAAGVYLLIRNRRQTRVEVGRSEKAA
jgi:hypothetical protein